MLTTEQAAEMEALKAERVEVERIIRAPRRLGEIVARLSQLERAGERAEARRLADQISPGWRQRLELAEAELAHATEESDRLFQAAAARERAAVFGPEYPTGSLPDRIGEVAPGMAALVPEIGRDPVRGHGRDEAHRPPCAGSSRSRPTQADSPRHRRPNPAAEEAPRRRADSWAMTTSMVGRVCRRSNAAPWTPYCVNTAAEAISAVQREPRGAIRPPTPGTAVLFVAGLLEYRQSVLSAIFGSGTSTAELRGDDPGARNRQERGARRPGGGLTRRVRGGDLGTRRHHPRRAPDETRDRACGRDGWVRRVLGRGERERGDRVAVR